MSITAAQNNVRLSSHDPSFDGEAHALDMVDTHTHTHTHSFTHTHTHIHTCIYAYIIHTCIHACRERKYLFKLRGGGGGRGEWEGGACGKLRPFPRREGVIA